MRKHHVQGMTVERMEPKISLGAGRVAEIRQVVGTDILEYYPESL